MIARGFGKPIRSRPQSPENHLTVRRVLSTPFERQAPRQGAENCDGRPLHGKPAFRALSFRTFGSPEILQNVQRGQNILPTDRSGMNRGPMRQVPVRPVRLRFFRDATQREDRRRSRVHANRTTFRHYQLRLSQRRRPFQLNGCKEKTVPSSIYYFPVDDTPLPKVQFACTTESNSRSSVCSEFSRVGTCKCPTSNTGGSALHSGP